MGSEPGLPRKGADEMVGTQVGNARQGVDREILVEVVVEVVVVVVGVVVVVDVVDVVVVVVVVVVDVVDVVEVVVVDVLLTGALVVVVLVVVELLELQPDSTIATTTRILRHRKGMVNRCLFK